MLVNPLSPVYSFISQMFVNLPAPIVSVYTLSIGLALLGYFFNALKGVK